MHLNFLGDSTVSLHTNHHLITWRPTCPNSHIRHPAFCMGERQGHRCHPGAPQSQRSWSLAAGWRFRAMGGRLAAQPCSSPRAWCCCLVQPDLPDRADRADRCGMRAGPCSVGAPRLARPSRRLGMPLNSLDLRRESSRGQAGGLEGGRRWSSGSGAHCTLSLADVPCKVRRELSLVASGRHDSSVSLEMARNHGHPDPARAPVRSRCIGKFPMWRGEGGDRQMSGWRAPTISASLVSAQPAGRSSCVGSWCGILVLEFP